MPLTREQKATILQDLITQFKEAKLVIFAQNLGLTVSEIADLRKDLREKDVSFKIAKKTLMRLAAKEAGYKEEIATEDMKGPIGVAFSFSDEVVAANSLYKFGKATRKIKLGGGILEGKIISKNKVNYLATIPSKDELLAKLIGSIKAPISGFYSVLHGTLAGFVRATKAYKEQKEQVA